jgi:hypothetical protein
LSWERLAIVRTTILVVAGLAFLCVAAWSWDRIAGMVAVGAALLLVEFLTAPDKTGGRP